MYCACRKGYGMSLISVKHILYKIKKIMPCVASLLINHTVRSEMWTLNHIRDFYYIYV